MVHGGQSPRPLTVSVLLVPFVQGGRALALGIVQGLKQRQNVTVTLIAGLGINQTRIRLVSC